MTPFRHTSWVALTLCATLWLAGCATTQPLEPRELRYSAPMEQTFREAVALMVEQGYVIRHADLTLGRAGQAWHAGRSIASNYK